MSSVYPYLVAVGGVGLLMGLWVLVQITRHRLSTGDRSTDLEERLIGCTDCGRENCNLSSDPAHLEPVPENLDCREGERESIFS